MHVSAGGELIQTTVDEMRVYPGDMTLEAARLANLTINMTRVSNFL